MKSAKNMSVDCRKISSVEIISHAEMRLNLIDVDESELITNVLDKVSVSLILNEIDIETIVDHYGVSELVEEIKTTNDIREFIS